MIPDISRTKFAQIHNCAMSVPLCKYHISGYMKPVLKCDMSKRRFLYSLKWLHIFLEPNLHKFTIVQCLHNCAMSLLFCKYLIYSYMKPFLKRDMSKHRFMYSLKWLQIFPEPNLHKFTIVQCQYHCASIIYLVIWNQF